MLTLEFSEQIEASPEKIWEALWDIENYNTWTSIFSEGSSVKTDGWKEGTTVHFLGPNGEGMYSMVAKHIPNVLLKFRHVGVIKDGKEQPLDQESQKWTGSEETYRILSDGLTWVLHVDVDTLESYADYFHKTFPLALLKVKEIAEKL